MEGGVRDVAEVRRRSFARKIVKFSTTHVFKICCALIATMFLFVLLNFFSSFYASFVRVFFSPIYLHCIIL